MEGQWVGRLIDTHRSNDKSINRQTDRKTDRQTDTAEGEEKWIGMNLSSIGLFDVVGGFPFLFFSGRCLSHVFTSCWCLVSEMKIGSTSRPLFVFLAPRHSTPPLPLSPKTQRKRCKTKALHLNSRKKKNSNAERRRS